MCQITGLYFKTLKSQSPTSKRVAKLNTQFGLKFSFKRIGLSWNDYRVLRINRVRKSLMKTKGNDHSSKRIITIKNESKTHKQQIVPTNTRTHI